ncbi:MAG: hypothetical protein Fur009_5230 [Candidatus Microgenomates bacterium]
MKYIIDFLNKDFFKFLLKENNSIVKGKEEYSGFLRRFGAILVDIALFCLLMIYLIKINLLNYPNSFIVFIIFPLYNALSLYFYRMTLGKYIFGIKIRNQKGTSYNFFDLLKREYILKPISLIFFGIGIWRIFIDSHKQTYYDKKLNIEVVIWRNSWINNLFIFSIIFSLLFEIIMINKQNSSNHLNKIKEKNKIIVNNRLHPTPTPTIYQCPVINEKTKDDLEKQEVEKKLLPCDQYDENYCQLKNNDS